MNSRGCPLFAPVADVLSGGKSRRLPCRPRYILEPFSARVALIQTLPFLGQEPNTVSVNKVRLAGFELGVPGEPEYIASYKQIPSSDYFCQRYRLDVSRSRCANRQQSKKTTTVAVLAKL
jgi:hypothetical protein